MFAMMVLLFGGGTLALWERARAGDREALGFGGAQAALAASAPIDGG
jgi:hypothetical protein